MYVCYHSDGQTDNRHTDVFALGTFMGQTLLRLIERRVGLEMKSRGFIKSLPWADIDPKWAAERKTV